MTYVPVFANSPVQLLVVGSVAPVVSTQLTVAVHPSPTEPLAGSIPYSQFVSAYVVWEKDSREKTPSKEIPKISKRGCGRILVLYFYILFKRSVVD